MSTKNLLYSYEHPYVEKVLVLSTDHLPRSQPFFGKHEAVPHRNGFVVFVSEEEPVYWLRPIMRIAWRDDCTLILFDRDGAVDPDLPDFS